MPQDQWSQLSVAFNQKRGLPSDNLPMSDQEFVLLSDLIYRYAGITLPLTKKSMLVSRLLKRLRALGLHSFLEYYNYITSPAGRQAELSQTIDLVSTNKTDFFREPDHFTFLAETVLPELFALNIPPTAKKINTWSAGCSSGEEPYTLAMILAEFVQARSDIDFCILATDISHRVLDRGRRAVYSENDIEVVPGNYHRKYFMRGVRGQEGYYRVVPELRNRIIFRYLNLMDASFPSLSPMDFIFCRNVMIYFDHKTRTNLIEKFYNQLVEGGYLFIGHSETLHGMETNFKLIRPTVYRKL